jgi:phage terminase large subunit-like protein
LDIDETNIGNVCRTLVPGYDPWRDAGDCGFDPVRAMLAVRFFPMALRHSKGAMAGEPFTLQPWQAAIIGNLFGWYRADGLRRYRYTLIYVPRKNGKTCLAAGIILYMLFADGEPGAEIYGAASEYSQACLVFDHARGMVQQNPKLTAACKLYLGQAKSIQLARDPLSTYKVIAYSPKAQHGGNTHAAVVDELHTLPNRELIDVLNTSKGSRLQPLMVYLTTADYEREGSICNEIHSKAQQVRDGSVSLPSFLPVIYEATRDCDWNDPAVWEQANPNWGVSVYPDFIEHEHAEAKRTPGFENTFKRLHLNIRTEQADRWSTMDEWDRGQHTFDPASMVGRECYAGLDLGYVSDLTALCLLFPLPELVGDTGEQSFNALWWFWSPRAKAAQDERKRGWPFAEFDRGGHIHLTPDDETDYGLIRKEIGELLKRYTVVELAMDRNFQGVPLSHALSEEDGIEVVAFGQGFMSMSAPTAEFGRLVRSGRIHHNNNPVMRWMIGGTAVKMDPAGNIKPNKADSGCKIDGVVAAIMALGRTMDRDRTGPSPAVIRGPVFVDM